MVMREDAGLQPCLSAGTVPDPTTDSLAPACLWGVQGGRMRDYKAPHTNLSITTAPRTRR